MTSSLKKSVQETQTTQNIGLNRLIDGANAAIDSKDFKNVDQKNCHFN